ncbi:MAG: LysR family transcriptional regulator [Pigmentiphaga sp.]
MRQLQVFLHVARIGNFTRAAEKVHMTQAGLSILIREMENQLDCRLFDRTTRMVTLTEAGQDLLPVAQRVVSELENITARIGETAQRARQVLRIAATPLVSSSTLPHVFQTFERTHPHVELRLFDGSLPRVEAMVEAGDVDLGLGIFFRPPANLECQSLGQFRLMKASPAQGQSTSLQRTAAWNSLKDAKLIGLPTTDSIQRFIEPHLQKIGRGYEERPVFHSLETLVSMVGAGVGTAVVPTQALEACQRHNVTTELLIKPAVNVDFYQLTRRGVKQTELMHDFCEEVKRALPQS